MKKIIAVILAVIMISGIMAPLTLAADTQKNYPVVYVTGYGPNIFSEKGNTQSEVYYPTGADVGAIVKEAIVPCLKELAAGVLTNNYDKYCDELYNAIHPIYENLVLAPDGTPKDNSGRGENLNLPVRLNYNRFSGGEENFPYDWRLSPETSAEELDSFINKMLAETGAAKVNIVARCLGGNVVSAYLENFTEEATQKINEIVFFIPSTEGINMIGALFAGEIEIVAENLDTFIDEYTKYEKVIEDPAIRDLVYIMVAILDQAKVLNLGTDALQMLIDKIKDNLVPRIIRRSYGSFPSFWSMVPTEYFEDALEFAFSTPELKEEYAGTIEKARSYHDNVMLNSRERIAQLSDKIDINIVSKYNIPLLPIIADCNNTSDGTAETYLTSFGATTADFGKNLSSDYLASVSEANKKYISPDEKIDASTCVLPDTTWFVKNSFHDHFPASIDMLIERILTTDMDVFSDPQFPQFLDANVDAPELTPVTEKEPEAKEDNFFTLLVKFIKSIIDMLLSLFKIG